LLRRLAAGILATNYLVFEVRNDGGLHPQHKRFYDGAVRLDVDSAELRPESD
jgi:hypothetical protein